MADFVSITAPAVGDPTELDGFAEPVLANQAELIARLTGLQDLSGIPNGSFELGSVADTAPAGFDLTIAAGNSTAFDTDTADVRHGRQSFSMTSPGGVTGGVTLTSSAFLLCAEAVGFALEWLFKASVATTTNAVKVLWYREDETFINTSTLYSAATGNPTSWTAYAVNATPPAGAKLWKLSLEGVNSSVAGVSYWDGLQVKPWARQAVIFTADGTYTPAYTGKAKARLWAGGGGGGGGARTSAGNNGTDGEDSYIGSTSIKARGGGGGAGGVDGSTGGAGAAAKQPTYTATLAQFGSQAGASGTDYNGTTGAAGGGVPYIPNGIMVATLSGINGNSGGNQPDGTAAPYVNTSQGGVGGTGAFYPPSSIYGAGGAGGQNGEYAEAIIDVVAGVAQTVQVGLGGVGGAALGSNPTLSGAGGAGQSGLVIIEELG